MTASPPRPTASTPPAAPLPGRPAARVGLDRLVARHEPFVRRYLRVLGAGHELDDLVQETFLALLSRPFVDRGPRPTAAFLRRTARHLFLRRHRGRMPQVVAADQVWDRRCGDGDGDGSDYVDALRACVGRLDGRARALVEATYRRGLGREAVAGELGMTANGVKAALRRVRRTLGDCIERRLGR